MSLSLCLCMRGWVAVILSFALSLWLSVCIYVCLSVSFRLCRGIQRVSVGSILLLTSVTLSSTSIKQASASLVPSTAVLLFFLPISS